MIPLRDNSLRRNHARVTSVLILFNGVVFLFQMLLTPAALSLFFETFALIPSRYFGSGAKLRAIWDYFPFVTNMFLHGGLFHLVANMWTLWIFGPAVEERIGPGRYLLFYLVAGLAASWTHAIVNAASSIPTLGASGAISGIMGCYIRLFPRSKLLMLVPLPFFPLFLPIPALYYMGFWLLTQVGSGLVDLLYPRNTGGVAWWAHIGGFAAGWYLVPFFNRQKRRRSLLVDHDETWYPRSTTYRRYFW